MDGERIKSAFCWQSTTETEVVINAKIFVDCSGDGLFAATSGAEYRTGREGKAEFGEKYAPDEPDEMDDGGEYNDDNQRYGASSTFLSAVLYKEV